MASAAATDLERLYAEWFDALARRDRAFFERTLAEDWVYTNIFGERKGKGDYLALVDLLAAGSAPPRLLELEAREHGGVVLAVGRYAVEPAVVAGRQVGCTTRFTALWARCAGSWQALAHHATREGG